jgi:hypothetical protein
MFDSNFADLVYRRAARQPALNASQARQHKRHLADR